MRLKQTQRVKQTQHYKNVLRNFFVMTTTVIILFSLGLIIMINVGSSEKSYASKANTFLVDNIQK